MSNSLGAAALPEGIFVGREEQTGRIYFEYDKLLRSEMGIAVIAGKAGAGKTYFARRALSGLGTGTYFYGKYRENDTKTLTAVADILREITDAAATFPKKTFDNILSDLQSNIGEDMMLLSSICPEMKNAFGIEKTVNIENFNKLKYRIKNAVFAFVSIMARYLFPLLIYIDDLQWADQLSLDIIRTLVSKKEALNIMLVLSLRPEEMDEYGEKLLSFVQGRASYISLENLSADEADDYLKEAFGGKLANKELLKKLLMGLTLGNPFYIKELLNILLEENVLFQTEQGGKYEFKTGVINDFLINENMELLLSSRIRSEMRHNGYVLELLACMDGQAEYSLIKKTYNVDETRLNDYIGRMENAAIIIRQTKGGSGSLLFAHDIIYKLVLSNIPENKREQIHYVIACALRDDDVTIPEKCSVLVSHIIRCSIDDLKADAAEWVALLYEEGCAQKNKAAIDAALAIFEFAAKLISSCEHTERMLYVGLHLELAECLFLYNRLDECSRIMDELEEKFRETKEKIAIKRKLIYLYQYKRDHQMVLKTGAEILKQLRFRFGIHRMPLDLLRAMYVYRPSKLKTIEEAPQVTDDELLLTIQVLTLMNVSAALTDDKLTAPIGLSAALAAAKNGNSGDSLIGYASYCYVLYLILKDYKNAAKFAETIAKISSESTTLENKSVVYFLLGGYLSHWSGSLSQADDYLLKSVYFGERTADFAFVGYSVATSVTTKFSMGMKLDSIAKFIDKCRMNYPEMDQYVTKYVFEVTLKHIDELKHGFDDYDYRKVAGKYSLLTPLETISEEEIMFHKLIFMDRVEEGYNLAREVTPKIKIANGLLSSLELIFGSALFRILMHNRLTGREKSSNLKIIKKQMKDFKHWRDLREDNYGARYLLLLSQYKVHILHDMSGAEMLNQAILSAEQSGNLYIQAACCVIAARNAKANEKLSGFYSEECIRALDEWGADFLSEKVKEEFCLEQDEKHLVDEKEGEKEADYEACITGFYEKIEGMGEDETARCLLEEIIKNNCAEYSAVIYEEGGELFLKHESKIKKKAKTYSLSVNISHITNLAHKIIRYAHRTCKDTIVDSENTSMIFSSDAHIAGFENIYIAAIPIAYHDTAIGILYLEKYDTPISAEKILYIKSLMPALITHQRKIKDIDVKSILSSGKKSELLTKREQEILLHISEGLSNQDISERLKISLGTTKKHISNIMMKLGTDNRVKAIIKAKEMNLI
ncbi:MAG: AAA family ATPase [Clostridia bacterium]|nr:AAA family ATPase [Clostridia bacterium]